MCSSTTRTILPEPPAELKQLSNELALVISAKIARFRGELLDLLDNDLAHDDVYRLDINFFPITRIAPCKESDDG